MVDYTEMRGNGDLATASRSSVGPYYAMPYLDKYTVIGSGDATTVLEHSPDTKETMEFLAAHMNHAWHRGRIAGGEDRARQMRAVLGLER